MQYRLEAQDGKLVWFHRDSLGNTVFSVTTDSPVLTANVWAHIVVTYTVVTGTAQIFINGELNKKVAKDPNQRLSTDWEKYAGKKTLTNKWFVFESKPWKAACICTGQLGPN